MSETKQFKTESKRLLDLMIHSIYTNREIFLRELISNASDAIDKYHYLSLTNDQLEKRNDYEIRLSMNEKDRTITIEDNGIGMTHDELVKNLGTIASSGSAEFLKMMEEKEQEGKSDVDIIGQFGVGFYSLFMVGKKVLVETKSPFDEKAYSFISDGQEKYTIDVIDKEKVGTRITIYLRDNTDEEDYDVFLNAYELERLVKKYSDYIRYPIRMLMSISKPDLDEKGEEIGEKYHDEVEDKTLNSMLPLWKKNKKEVSKEELNEFYKNKFYATEDPLLSSFVSIEGALSYQALLYVPARAPYDLYSDKYEKGLQLYTKGVFIMDKCKDLIPDYLKFVKGLVDSSDLSLNVSREILQQNRQLEKIANHVEKKILSELSNLLKDDFKKYCELFQIYGTHLKWGAYENYGMKKDQLKDLLIYSSIDSEDFITLKQYKEAMKEGQKKIYYASGKDKVSIMSLPQMDALKKKGYNVLVLTDDIDEFCLTIMHDYDGVEFQSITDESLDVSDEEEKKQVESLKEEKKDLLDKMKACLVGKVDDVRLSSRLVDSPVCLVSGEGLSFEMEKVLKKMPNGENAKAGRILEINPNHDLLQAISKLYERHPDKLMEYSNLLYTQALIIEGLPIENPAQFSKDLCNLMIEAIQEK